MDNSALIKSRENCIKNYLRAKDHNKPYLMKNAFENSATLSMKVKTDIISFPSDTVGLEAITNVLVKNFSQTYENIYTFCLSDSIINQDNSMSCNWLVCMSEKNSGNIRIGFGKYDWQFNNNESELAKVLATHLLITIQHMQVIKPEYLEQIMQWITALSYPFCTTKNLSETMPDIEPLAFIELCKK